MLISGKIQSYIDAKRILSQWLNQKRRPNTSFIDLNAIIECRHIYILAITTSDATNIYVTPITSSPENVSYHECQISSFYF